MADLERGLQSDDADADVSFNVQDTAAAIVSELAETNPSIDAADEFSVSFGVTDISGAQSIQGHSGYNDGNSTYDISDSASAIINNPSNVYDDGVDVGQPIRLFVKFNKNVNKHKRNKSL